MSEVNSLLLPMSLKQASIEYFQGKVSYSKLRAMAKAGTLPVTKIGGRYFVRKDLLDAWFAQQQIKTVPDSQYGKLRVING
ncbi:helix-turn-helix domain-containing protein [Sporomusa aerivorans]|uniref:helix-turn-helix domain-containing protein n=1 Tax=Sporomusa aerivorans TaxID=204936 RepID=UPI00352BCDB6